VTTKKEAARRRQHTQDRYKDLLDRVVGQLICILPGLEAAAAQEALQQAAPIPTQVLTELFAHLTAHPDALTSGDAHCPIVLLRLAHALHAAGQPVARPACASCGTVRTDLRSLTPQGRVCSPCNLRTHTGTCARCGREEAPIRARGPEGRICQTCYNTDTQRHAPCSDCGRTRRVTARLPDGSILCPRCHNKPDKPCTSCTTAPDTGRVCTTCFTGYRRARRMCGHCGQLRIISRKATADTPDLCETCYRGPQAICSRCGRTRPCHHASTAAPICGPCLMLQRPRVQCARCSKTRPACAYWPLGPVCKSCYNTILCTPRPCARCHDRHPLIAQNDAGQGLCARCVGHSTDYACASCGRTGHPFATGHCAYCVLRERLTRTLTGPHGHPPEQLQPLIDAFDHVPRPGKCIEWLARSPCMQQLAHLASSGQPLTHELLDTLPPGRDQNYLRQLLVHTGVLKPREDDLDRLAGWLEHQLATRPDHHAAVMRPFLHWHLLRRARRRAATRPYPASDEYGLRARARAALDLLSWLDTQHLALGDLRQPHLDQWLTEGATTRYTISHFLNWTRQRRLTAQLAVPGQPKSQPADFLDDNTRWTMLRRCLADEALPLDIRAVGALVLLFGLPVQRLRHLTTDQLHTDDSNVFLNLADHALLLPPRLGNLLLRLAQQHSPRSALTDPAQRLLFPGVFPGRPLSAEALTRGLAQHDIPTRSARNAALAALAADLPSPVLADLLGLHPTTATRWVNYARKDWSEYVAHRATKAKIKPAERTE
jgi:hypothetical protein